MISKYQIHRNKSNKRCSSPLYKQLQIITEREKRQKWKHMFMITELTLLIWQFSPFIFIFKAIQLKSQQALFWKSAYSKCTQKSKGSKIVKITLKNSKVQPTKLPEIKTIKLQSSQQVVLDQGPKVWNKEYKLEPHLAGDKASASTQ